MTDPTACLEETRDIAQCNICGKHAICRLLTSGIAPITYNACNDCESRGAESTDVVMTWIALSGGLKSMPEHGKTLTTWLSGGYVGWEDLRKYYLKHEARILEEMNEEVILEDDEIDFEEDGS